MRPSGKRDISQLGHGPVSCKSDLVSGVRIQPEAATASQRRRTSSVMYPMPDAYEEIASVTRREAASTTGNGLESRAGWCSDPCSSFHETNLPCASATRHGRSSARR